MVFKILIFRRQKHYVPSRVLFFNVPMRVFEYWTLNPFPHKPCGIGFFDFPFRFKIDFFQICCAIIKKPSYCFPYWLHQFTFSLTSAQGFPFLHILANTHSFVLLRAANLKAVRWYLTVPLIFISLMINDVEHLFMYCCPFACLLWKNIYPVLLLIF